MWYRRVYIFVVYDNMLSCSIICHDMIKDCVPYCELWYYVPAWCHEILVILPTNISTNYAWLWLTFCWNETIFFCQKTNHATFCRIQRYQYFTRKRKRSVLPWARISSHENPLWSRVPKRHVPFIISQILSFFRLPTREVYYQRDGKTARGRQKQRREFVTSL